MNFILRDFALEDRAFFLSCSEEFYSMDAVDKPVSSKFFERTFDECMKGSPFVQGMIFLVGGERAGFALLTFTYSNEVGGLVVLIDEVFILDKYRGEGIGKGFFELIEERYVVAGKAKRLRLEVTVANTAAKALYERMGFKQMSYIQMSKEFTV